MIDIIRDIFRKYGYAPLETPAMENLSTLTGKYGEEGDKLLFKILNSGDFLKGIHLDTRAGTIQVESVTPGIQSGAGENLQNPGQFREFYSRLSPYITEKGLRYDLTVPFARYVVQHQGEIVFPFKRFQIQPVWRADRPQKGRYREFYQCDVDVIGSRSLVNEVELIKIVEEVFGRLGINVTLKMNNRKILAGIAEAVGYADKMMDITVAIDKIDKIGLDGVVEELKSKDISRGAIDRLKPILKLSGANAKKLAKLKDIISVSETGMRGIAEMETIFGYLNEIGTELDIEIDLSLARGLNYYTGAIFEVKAKDFEIGSICGGGRYDDLTGIFGMPDTSGVGISFGADRIYDVMLGLDLFPEEASMTTKVLFINFGGREELASLKLLRDAREAGVYSELYPESVKMKKQMEYANRRGIPFVVIIGEDEYCAREATVKDMRSGRQYNVSFEELVASLTQ